MMLKKAIASVALSLLIAAGVHAQDATAKHSFAIEGSQMLLDGKPFQMLSGEVHFSRIPPELWRDRLKRVKAMGLNTVAIYVFWNVHEPEPGQYNFSGSADVAKFCKIAQEEGLYVFLRPGPYCCAEWEFGGFPYWLLKDRDMKIRSKDPKFFDTFRKYDIELGKQLAPLQIDRGGPIIMVQCENEYGSFDKDKDYLGDVKKAIRDAGFTVPLCTVDGGGKMAINGSLEGLLPGINGGNVKSTKESVDAIRPGGPYMVGEFYPGWLDHWGEPFVKSKAEGVAKRFDALLAAGYGVNVYMVHGGTNFDFMNGSNGGGKTILPSITSYDYDAPISEAGHCTPKYFAMREVLAKYNKDPIPTPPADNPVATFAPVTLTESAPASDLLGKPVESDEPKCFEDLNQAYGFVLYRTKITKPVKGDLTVARGIRDYATVLVDGKVVGVVNRQQKIAKGEQAPVLALDLPAGAQLDLLVENLGRVNYGAYIRDNLHGIIDTVSVGDTELHGWQNFSLPMTDLSALKFTAGDITGVPAFHRGTFHVDKAADAFIDFRGWGKGSVWVNGHNIGRFWGIGPQQTLYCPGPWLKDGDNEIVVLVTADTGKRTVAGLAEPILDQLLKPTTRPDVPHGG